MSHVMRIMGLVNGPATSFDGEWVVFYDPTVAGHSPEGIPMSATLRTTPDPTRARRFRTGAEALECWREPSGRQRPDGRPDRPLTAFTVEVEKLD